MSTNIAIFFVAVFLFGAAAADAGERKLFNLDSQIQAQVYDPTPLQRVQLPPRLSVPPFLRNFVPISKNRYPDAALPLFFAPRFITPISRDLFSLSRDMLNAFDALFQFPRDMNYQEKINQIQQLMDDGQIPEQYVGYAQAFLSLLRDQPVLRALQESIAELRDSTSFNFSTSGKGLDDLRMKYDFNLPGTMITPAVQSSFAVASNPEAVAAEAAAAAAAAAATTTTPTLLDGKSSDKVSDTEMDEDLFLHE